MRAFAIWEGGLGIWGAIAFGGVGAWIACRRQGIPAACVRGRAGARAAGRAGDRAAGQLVQQRAVRQCRPSWALKIYEWDSGRAVLRPTASPRCWARSTRRSSTRCSGTWPRPRWWSGPTGACPCSRAFALYVASYCAGRLWIELLRTDPAETFFGVRLNVFTSIIVGLLAVAYLVAARPAAGSSPRARTMPGATPPRCLPAGREPRPEGSGDDGHRRPAPADAFAQAGFGRGTDVILPTRGSRGLRGWDLCYACVPYFWTPAILAGSPPSEPGQRRPADDSPVGHHPSSSPRAEKTGRAVPSSRLSRSAAFFRRPLTIGPGHRPRSCPLAPRTDGCRRQE